MALVVVDSEYAHIERGRVWRTEWGSASITSGADYKLGIITGDRQVVVTSRAYSSTTPKIIAGLYEAEFTGGTPPRLFNRRLGCLYPAPFTAMMGVTASLGAVITQATINAGAATGNAQASFTGDAFAIILEPNTSYVVSLQNGGANTAEIGLAFDSRTDAPLNTYNERP
jgi:hypothetical protein